MLTEKDYCDYETCVALREVGFTLDMTEKVYERNLMTNRYETIPKPLLYEAQKWLREEKSVIIVVCPYSYNLLHELHTWTYEIWLGDNLESQANNFDYYEEALSEGVRETVKILKEQKC